MASAVVIFIALGSVLNGIVVCRGEKYKVEGKLSGPVNRYPCTYDVKVSGNGISDLFHLPCDVEEKSVIVATTEYALFDSPSSPLAFFSDEANTLVILKNGKCTKRKYKVSSDGELVSKDSSMWAFNCNRVLKKMDAVENAHAKAQSGWDKVATAIQNGKLSHLL